MVTAAEFEIMSDVEGDRVEEVEQAIQAAIKNIRECLKRNKTFTQVSFDNFKKNQKDNYEVIKKLLKSEINEHSKWIDEILSLAANSKNEDTINFLSEVNIKMKQLLCGSAINFTDNNEDKNDGKSDDNSAKTNANDLQLLDGFFGQTKSNFRTKESYRPRDRETDRPRERLSIERLRCASQDVETWFRRYELETRDYSGENRAFYLPLYLTDDAFDAYDRFPGKNYASYERLKEYIIKSLFPDKSEKQAWLEFSNARQRPDEDVKQFANRLQKMVNYAPEACKDKMFEELKETYINGCEKSIRNYLIGEHSRMKLDEIVSKAVKLERSEREARSTLAALRKQSEGEEEEEDSINAINRRAECFKCHKTGHWAKECKSSTIRAATTTQQRMLCVFCGSEEHLAKDCAEWI